MKRWCETDTPEKRCRFQDMTLKKIEVKGVPDVEAYVCPNCDKARWLPLSSLEGFLTGLSNAKV